MAPPWAVRVLSMRQRRESLAVLPNSELNGERLSRILVFLERDSKSTDSERDMKRREAEPTYTHLYTDGYRSRQR